MDLAVHSATSRASLCLGLAHANHLVRGAGDAKDLLEKVKVLLGKFWQQGVKVFEDCRVSVKS